MACNSTAEWRPVKANVGGSNPPRPATVKGKEMETSLKIDARGIPTCECPSCGSNTFKIVAMFDPEDYEISMYALDAECATCGSMVTAPTPLDHPEYEPSE